MWSRLGRPLEGVSGEALSFTGLAAGDSGNEPPDDADESRKQYQVRHKAKEHDQATGPPRGGLNRCCHPAEELS